MDRYSRIVFGFHGTDPDVAERLIRGELVAADWKPKAAALSGRKGRFRQPRPKAWETGMPSPGPEGAVRGWTV